MLDSSCHKVYERSDHHVGGVEKLAQQLGDSSDIGLYELTLPLAFLGFRIGMKLWHGKIDSGYKE